MMRALVRLGLCLSILFAASRALADNPTREAGAHFQRGVELYNDGDFRGALVEFKRAYSIWPRANVLYDIGQTEYQLLDYASSLRTMERYLAETGPNAAHRPEVESTVEVLRGRVGRLAINTDANDCDITIDEQPVGTTPIQQVLLVSVGSRRVAAVCPGRPTTIRQVEVAAGETVRLDLKLRPPPMAALRNLTLPAKPTPKAPPTKEGLTIGWTVSAILAAATIAVGSSALVEQSQLETLKRSYPVTHDMLANQASLTGGLAIAADALGVATLAAIGVSTYLTIKYDRERKVRLSLNGSQVLLVTTF